MQRWQVKADQKDWGEHGPDLLRVERDALTQLRQVMSGAVTHQGKEPFWVRTRVVSTGEFRDWKEVGSAKDVVERFAERMPANAQVGVRNPGGVDLVAAIRARTIYVPNFGSATEACGIIMGLLNAAFPQHDSAGYFNCRGIGGAPVTEKPSQHAWGNAYDARGSEALVREMGTWMVRMADSRNAPVSQVIAGHLQWFEGVSSTYTPNDHELHVHTSGTPYLTGVPPCAYRR